MAKRKQGARQIARDKRVRELKTEYRKLATQANRRMTNLEKLAENPEYKAVLGYAYKDVVYNLKALTGGTRFKHDIERMGSKETDIRKLQQLIATAKQFLDAPSSTKTGIDKTYKKRARTINKKYGTSFSSDDLKVFFESAIWEKLKNKLGSAVAMITMGKIQKKSSDILNEIDENRKKHKAAYNNFSVLNDVDGLNINEKLTREDRKIIGNLAKIYAEK